VATSERQWNGFLNNAMATDEFSQVMGRFMDVYLNGQKQLNEVMGRYLQSVNVPTRNDILAIGERLSQIEERMMRLERAITNATAGASSNGAQTPAAPAAAAAPAAPRPARTKKPEKS